MNITVYLASSEGKDPTLREAVRAFGTWIGESGNALVYGGSKSGLMGVLAESVIEAGGEARTVPYSDVLTGEITIDEIGPYPAGR